METTTKTTTALIAESMSTAMDYQQYRDLVSDLATKGLSTGPNQTEALINYTVLNDRRMRRWDKTLKMDEATVAAIAKVKKKTTWLVLTESWCGDASPSLPVMQKISELNPNITVKIILRDEHVGLMERFLTNGGMSIPKLIAIDDETNAVTGDWGPRSTAAAKLVEDYKTAHGSLTAEFKQDLQVWYNRDKGQSVFADLTQLLALE